MFAFMGTNPFELGLDVVVTDTFNNTKLGTCAST